MTLRDRVKELCKEKGVSLNQLEKDCNFGKGYLSKLGKSAPSSENLGKIADYFGVTLDYLNTGNDPKLKIYEDDSTIEMYEEIRKNPDAYILLSKFIRLSSKKKHHVLELVELLSE